MSPSNRSMKPPFFQTLTLLAMLGYGLWGQSPVEGGSLTLNVIDFGAVGDGVTVNTGALQKAIDTCSEKGGGLVQFPEGQFVTGTLQMKDNVTLSLPKGAALLGSLQLDDYLNLDPFHSGSDGSEQMGYALIVGREVKNVGLMGEGVIDGRGAALKKASAKYDRRPFLVRWIRCKGVTIQGIHLINSGAWTLNVAQSREVTIQGITLHSVGLGNNDGIDLDSSQTVHIKDCTIESDDDSLCFKATSPIACQDIQVSGCQLKSRQAGIKFGTESMGDFADITLTDCHIRESRGGLYLFSVDGSHLHNVQISDITMDKISAPLLIRLGARRKIFREGQIALPVGTLDGVSIKNVMATHCAPPGIVVSGLPGHEVEDLTLENIHLELTGQGKPWAAEAVVPEKEGDYPTPGMFGDLPAYGVYLRHLKNSTITGLTLTLLHPDPRAAIAGGDGTNLTFRDLTLPDPGPTQKTIAWGDGEPPRAEAVTLTPPLSP